MTDESPIIGPSGSPRTIVEYAAADAIEAATARLEIEGAELKQMLVIIVAEKTGEVWDAVTAGTWIEDPKDVFALLIGQAVGVGRQLGLSVKVATMQSFGQG